MRKFWRRKKLPDGGQQAPSATISEASVDSAAETGVSVSAATHHAQTPPVISSDDAPAASETMTELLWSQAYQMLRKREEELVVAYESYLSARASDHCAAFSSPEAGAELIRRLQEGRDEKQWRVPLGGREHKLRDQVEKLVKLLVFSDAVIKQAVSAQPYAALAWSGVSIFLPVGTQWNPWALSSH